MDGLIRQSAHQMLASTQPTQPETMAECTPDVKLETASRSYKPRMQTRC
jgi:hypothetical protein